MSQLAIITDLDRCVGCLACCTACKMVNEVPIGSYRNKVLRIGPTPRYEGAQVPDVDMYFLPVSCQHCTNPECVNVCPTGASYKAEDGTVRINAEQCIGCQACMSACPYGVRYLNEDTAVVDKCDLCAKKLDRGELPQCVINCGGHARWIGDLDEGLESFVAYDEPKSFTGLSYEDMCASRAKMVEFVKPFDQEDVYRLPDSGNGPAFAYILRKAKWQGEA